MRPPTSATGRPVPPRPAPARAVLPLPLLLWAIRRNVLATWGAPAYELAIVSRPFLGRRSFLVNDPAAIRRILVEEPESWGRPASVRRLLAPMLGEGLFLAEGDLWRRQRRLLQPAFSGRHLDRLAVVAARATDAALDRVAPHGRHAVDLLAFVQELTLTVACRVLFDLDIGPWAHRLRALITAYGATHARPAPGDFLLPAGVSGPADLGRARTARRFRALVREIVDALLQRAPPADAADVVTLLRSAADGADLRPPARRQLEDEVATLLVAGHETTALALFWALYLLALDPDAQERAAAEAASLPEAFEAAGASTASLRFLRAVLDETLRLYPPALSISREARVPGRLGREPVAPGDLVLVAPWVLHRHRRFWHEPDAFRPERFLDGGEPVDRFVYLPFGAGPRVCIGARFAVVEALVVLARVLRRFRIGLVGPRPVVPVGIVTIHPDRAPPFRLRPRDARVAVRIG